MAAPQQNQKMAPAPSKSNDDEELARMLAEDAAKAAAEEVAAPAPAAPVRLAGDVPVRVLRAQARVLLGGRGYCFKAGEEILMDPSHAKEMQDAGWVTVLRNYRA
jgi:hypothetical protein